MERINMKRYIFLTALSLFLLFAFSGCGQKKAAAEQSADSKDSILIGSAVKLDRVPDGFYPDTSSEALAANGMYYYSWKLGESTAGEDTEDAAGADYTDAQIYLITYEAVDGEDAASKNAAWQAGAKQHYTIETESEASAGGHRWQMISYRIKSSDSPFTHGISAFCADDNCAVCAELSCSDSYTDDQEMVLKDFLESLSF